MKINKENLKSLGRGVEKEVFENPDNPDLTLGIYHEYKDESVNLIKARFYLTKILHMLSPENMPDIHLVSSNPKLIVMDKVEGNDLVDEEKDWKKRQQEIKKLKDKFSNIGINILDDTPANFRYDYNGNLVYLDNLYPWGQSLRSSENKSTVFYYDEKKLEAALKSLKEQGNRELGLSYLERVEILRKEEFKNLSKAKSKNN
ncbi:MAG: hypothetical protein Q7S73_00385 [bacterium]|nr:hypothetical protein [bacterium]